MKRPWLLPFSPIYWMATSIRNAFFDLGILPSKAFPIPIIAVGNLTVGGTGKTPHVEWLLTQLMPAYRVAVLSRGYGRRTNGYVLADEDSTAREIGDEPMQIHQRFPGAIVAVCEKRVVGIGQLLKLDEPPEVILLDDAYQHRYVSPGLTWLLTPWDELYTRDYILPAGNLREDIRGAERANVITITKCPGELTPPQREEIRSELNPEPDQLLSYSRLRYADLVNPDNEPVERPASALVVTGIANPELLLNHLTNLGIQCLPMKFSDHRNFTHTDIEKIASAFAESDVTAIITTRKDYVRWPAADEKLRDLPTYIQDVAVHFGSDEGIIRRYFERFVADFDSNLTGL